MNQISPSNAPPQAPKKKGFPIGCIIAACLVVPLAGILGTVALYGVRKYIASARTAEAKSTIGGISRSAKAAYETPGADGKHHLCGSSVPVPATIAAVTGVKYTPAHTPGSDFGSGTALAGWTCLKFEMSTPIQYQYHYHAGSGYAVPANAPGPNGFQAAAIGDLNGDGVQSLFSRTGVIDASGQLELSSQIYLANEFE
jgi:type IV pilus assembly protein PilA